MRDLGGIMVANSPSGIVMREAIKRGDYDVIDLLSCGSGYDVTEEERILYFAHGNNSVFFGE